MITDRLSSAFHSESRRPNLRSRVTDQAARKIVAAAMDTTENSFQTPFTVVDELKLSMLFVSTPKLQKAIFEAGKTVGLGIQTYEDYYNSGIGEEPVKGPLIIHVFAIGKTAVQPPIEDRQQLHEHENFYARMVYPPSKDGQVEGYEL